MSAEVLLSTTSYAAAAGLSPRQVQRYLAEGRLPGAVKHGSAWRIPASARPVEHGATSNDVVPTSYAVATTSDLGGVDVALDAIAAPVVPVAVPRLLTLDEVAAALGTSVGAVRRMGEDGFLVVRPFGPHGALRVVVPAG